MIEKIGEIKMKESYLYNNNEKIEKKGDPKNIWGIK